MAIGIDADEVFHELTMSSAMRSLGAPSLRAIDSMIRRLAWCGTNAARSSGATPAWSQAALATGCSAVVAQRNTAWPSCTMEELRSGMTMLSAMLPVLPQATGPMPDGWPA